ncbi:MAG TPA: type II toxin-antitoxin system HicB family antitoxin [Solirubrobacteraceae bacterium]|nr:type II toxin-antitoxin system HicB family antitoxin [Solirubrobacteraceae bacterium]
MSVNATRELTVRVHEGDDGWLWAEVRELPGCFASGRTLDELREALEESISLSMTDDAEVGAGAADAPRSALRVGEMRVTVPA